MIRAVLFDLDGVLVDSYEVWFPLLNSVAEDLGYPAISRESFRDAWGQGVSQDVTRFYPRHSVDEISQAYLDRFRAHGDRMVVNDDAVELFGELARRDIPRAVITNTPAGLAGEMLSCAELAPDVLVGGTDVPNAKPAPDMVLRACELVGVPPEGAIVVGDSRYDREAAAAAGTRFAGFGGIDAPLRLARLRELLEHL